MVPDSNLSAGQFGMSGNMGSSGVPSTIGAGSGGVGTSMGSNASGMSSAPSGGTCASC